MVEIWKDIPDYEGLYMISNYGNIKITKNNKLCKPSDDGKGYLQIVLTKNKKRKCYKIHKLVAKTYISNLDNLPQINHKDQNKKNNSINNLEWCTQKYNCNYGDRNYRCTKHRLHKVKQIDLKNNIIKEYNSLKEAESNTKIKYQQISACCRNIQKSAGGFLWEYC